MWLIEKFHLIQQQKALSISLISLRVNNLQATSSHHSQLKYESSHRIFEVTMKMMKNSSQLDQPARCMPPRWWSRQSMPNKMQLGRLTWQMMLFTKKTNSGYERFVASWLRGWGRGNEWMMKAEENIESGVTSPVSVGDWGCQSIGSLSSCCTWSIVDNDVAIGKQSPEWRPNPVCASGSVVVKEGSQSIGTSVVVYLIAIEVSGVSGV